MEKRVLVTGGAGYIGSHACKALAEAGFTPVVFDNLSAGRAPRVQWGPLEEGDVRNAAALESVVARYKPVAAMHFAGQISVPESVKNPSDTYAINTVGSFNLLQALKAHNVGAMVFSSTAAVYGTPQAVPIPEDAPKAPINPYGESKLVTEHMLRDFSLAYGLKFAALRYFNAAGATPEAGLGYHRPNPFHLVPMVMRAILGVQPALNVFGTDYPTPDGTAVRDYIHVRDLVRAHILALQHLLGEGDNLILNLGTSHGYSVKQVIATAEKVTGRPVPHVLGPRREGDPAELVADARQAQTLLNWIPACSDLETLITDDWAWHNMLLRKG